MSSSVRPLSVRVSHFSFRAMEVKLTQPLFRHLLSRLTFLLLLLLGTYDLIPFHTPETFLLRSQLAQRAAPPRAWLRLSLDTPSDTSLIHTLTTLLPIPCHGPKQRTGLGLSTTHAEARVTTQFGVKKWVSCRRWLLVDVFITDHKFSSSPILHLWEQRWIILRSILKITQVCRRPVLGVKHNNNTSFHGMFVAFPQ